MSRQTFNIPREKLVELAKIYHSTKFSSKTDADAWLKANVGVGYAAFYRKKKAMGITSTLCIE